MKIASIQKSWMLSFALIAVGCGGPREAEAPSVTAQSGPSETVDLSSSAAAPELNSSTVHASFYTVDHYDEARDASADLRATIARAQSEHKRILLQIGGDWCIWCKRMSHFLETNPAVRAAVEANFVLMKVTWTSEHPNEAFLASYPKVEAFPHLFVLESDGAFLHSQGTSELEQDQGYNEAVYLAFLKRWAPVR